MGLDNTNINIHMTNKLFSETSTIISALEFIQMLGKDAAVELEMLEYNGVPGRAIKVRIYGVTHHGFDVTLERIFTPD